MVTYLKKEKKGRPKKTTESLGRKWKAIVIDKMSEGASRQEVKAILGISNDLWERLMEEDQEFSETVKRGIELCEAWWLQQGRLNLQNRHFSAVLWYMNMKNRFGWSDRQKVNVEASEHPGYVVLPPEEPL